MPTQTPASRRFVLPSSTAPSRSQKQHVFASQFSRPSHNSSSPFTRTPFSSTAQKQRKDEIVADDSSHEDEDEVDADRSHASSHNNLADNLYNELAELTDDDDLLDGLQATVPTSGTPTSLIPQFQGPNVRSHKRRKLSHQTSDNIDDDGLDHSSPPSSPTRDHDNAPRPKAQLHVPHSSPLHASEEDVLSESPKNRSSSPASSTPTSPARDFQTPKHHKSRFRDPIPGLTSSTPVFSATPHPVVYPSFQSRLLASTSTSTSTNPTTTSPGPHIRGPRPTLDLTLPDAFSPSRKRGAREYIYGGIAETVRGWVVDVATIVAGNTTTPARSMSRHTSMQNTSAPHDHENHAGTTETTDENQGDQTTRNKMLVKEVLLTDNNGRFRLIHSRPGPTLNSNDLDDNARHDDETWMLINTDPQSRKPSSGSSRSEAHSRLATVKPGKTINIKGGEAMTWELNLNSDRTHQGDTVDVSRADTTRSCRVAVLWDVI